MLTYGGLLLVFAQSLDGGQKDLWLGAALAFASALCYAVYLVAGGEVIARVGSVRFTAYAMSAASVACILQWFLLRPLSALALPAPVYLYAIAHGGALSTAIPVFMTSEALRRVGANTVAIVGALGPVTTIVVRLPRAGRDHDAAAARRLGAGADRRGDHQFEASQAVTGHQ